MIDVQNYPTYIFDFILETKEKMLLPAYKGSMFRGAFGISFRRTVCITHDKTCDNCFLKDHCSYFSIFETEANELQLEILRGVKKVPHPFIIQPPNDRKTHFEKGDRITVTVKIFGDAVKFFPFFAFTFLQMGKTGISVRRHKFSVKQIINVISDDEKISVYDEESGNLKTKYKPFDNRKLLETNRESNSVQLKFLTPLRIQINNSVIRKKEDLTSEILMRAVFRRCKMITALYYGNNENTDFTPLLENLPEIYQNNLHYYHWERFSNRQKKKMEMSGFIGELELKGGNLQELLPYLALCSLWNIGKNTVFGLGSYEIR